MTKTTNDIEKFQYDHIFNLILDIFRFDEKKIAHPYLKVQWTLHRNGEHFDLFYPGSVWRTLGFKIDPEKPMEFDARFNIQTNSLIIAQKDI